jgi:hypothetical protein
LDGIFSQSGCTGVYRRPGIATPVDVAISAAKRLLTVCLTFATRVGGMTSVTVVPAQRGFARTISPAPLSDGIQDC